MERRHLGQICFHRQLEWFIVSRADFLPFSVTLHRTWLSGWKKAEEKTNGHEDSAQHRQSVVQWLIGANKKQSVC
jgi:hypothetical protein